MRASGPAVGPLGVDVTSFGGFDVTGPQNGRAYAALNLAGSPHISTLFAIDLATGTATAIGALGGLHGSPSANTGVLTTVGDLGVDVADDAAFDITPGGMALLTSGSEIFTVNLATGETRRTSNASVPHLTAIAIWPQQNPGF